MDHDLALAVLPPYLAHPFLKQQLVTYMGNKRKLLHHIDAAIDHVRKELAQTTISFADPFSGSGVVSRLALASGKVHHLATNDIAHYAHTANLCHLHKPTHTDTHTHIQQLITQANQQADNNTNHDPWIATHWAPQNDNHILPEERCYFTQENARRIDAIRNFIASDAVPTHLKPYLLAPLLSECSIHNNTNGQFAAYYRDGSPTKTGAFGGKHNVDYKRITQPIRLPNEPIWAPTTHTPTTITTHNLDINQWTQEMIDTNPHNPTPIDLIYIDPPYNKHPYAIYYFLLDIIDTWDKTIDIPNSYRGQPKTWTKSPFNSTIGATEALATLVAAAPAKFVALSYYDAGIIPVAEIDTMLGALGDVQKIPIRHGVYNRLHGLGAYKRKECAAGDSDTTSKSTLIGPECAKEYMWILRKHPTTNTQPPISNHQ